MKSSPPLVVAIATRERPWLLERTLRSLALCEVPGGLAAVVVVENGPVRQLDELFGKLAAPFPLVYRHVAAAGKNRALNEVVRAYPKAFIIFFDDDVRVDPQVLIEYSRAVGRGARRGVFFGGRCKVDFEEPPPAWIFPYLPESAKGWSKGEISCEIRQAMGFNWGAFARDILDAGGFQTGRGPGMPHSIGDETEMQARLVRRGVRGEYLPNAIVWHFVPIDRCSEEWVIQRARQMGIARGIQLAEWPAGERAKFADSCRRKARLLNLTAGLLGSLLGRRRACHLRRSRQWHLGVLEGLQLALTDGMENSSSEQSTNSINHHPGVQCEPLDRGDAQLRPAANAARR
jgi:cellulose synthase/poly-beta-1,6-N-acetylglucosamine synthase-like glycosyltransferase